MAKVKLNLTLEAETKEYLKILAIKEDTTVSNLIESYVKYLKFQESEQESILNKNKEMKQIINKQCKECKEVKNHSAFRNDRRNKDGLDSICKECRRKKDEDYYCKRLIEKGW